MSVRNLVESIQDIMRQDTGVDGDAQRISRSCRMFILEIIDDRDQELELLDSEHRSPIPTRYRRHSCPQLSGLSPHQKARTTATPGC